MRFKPAPCRHIPKCEGNTKASRGKMWVSFSPHSPHLVYRGYRGYRGYRRRIDREQRTMKHVDTFLCSSEAERVTVNH